LRPTAKRKLPILVTRDLQRISAEHLAEIEHKIADLTRLADELRRINGRCQGGGLIADCRIIEALSP